MPSTLIGTAAGRLGWPAGAAEWPLCGRDAEVELVRAALAETATGAGVVIVGPAGVGKTRLAQEAVAGLGRRPVHLLVGTPAAQAIPLAPLLDVLPDVGASPEEGIGRARTRLGGRRPRLVLLVDDAQWLDTATQTLLHSLVRTREVRVVATVRSDVEVPPTIQHLWKDGHLSRLDLGPLGPVESALLMEAVVGAPVEASVVADVYSRSQGLPLALRELLTEALSGGSLAVRDGLAQAVGPLPRSRRLHEVIVGNLRRLESGHRSVLDVVAVAEPVPLRLLSEVVHRDDMRAAERHGVIRSFDSRLAGVDRHVVMVGHPLYGQAALAELTPLDRRLVLERLIDAAQGMIETDKVLALRVASWCIEVGRPVPVEDLLTAVRLTHRAIDPALAAQAAQTLWRQRPSAETGLVYAAALARQLKHESKLEVLKLVADLGLTESQRVTRAAMVNEALVRLGRHDEAIEELAMAEAMVQSRSGRAHLTAKRAFTASVAGRTRDGIAVMSPLAYSDDPVEFGEAIATAPSMLALDGRALDGLALVERAERHDETTLGDPDSYLRLPREALTLQRGLCLMYAGQLTEAAAYAEDGLRVAEEYGLGYLLAGWLNILGRVQLDQGHPAAAIQTLGRVIAETPQASGGAQRALAYNALIEARSLLGQSDAARQALDRLLESPGNALWYPAGLTQLSQGHLAFSEGDRGSALRLFQEGYRRAAAQNATIALAAAHAVGRFGERRLGLDLARDLPDVQGPLAALRTAHLRALVDRDAKALLDVARRMEHLGADLFAAEACGAAAAEASRRGDVRLATTARRIGQPILRRVQAAVTPDLTAMSTAEAADLTQREREIALMAAKGMPSQTIAATLTLSVRTVENHLQRIYAKLGLSGRRDLPRAIKTVN
jgi:DNA-binding CsgD family transcriptional regulator